MSSIKLIKYEDGVATWRLTLSPRSKRSGRIGTRRAWKRKFPPFIMKTPIAKEDLKIPLSGVFMSQRLLSQKHLIPLKG